MNNKGFTLVELLVTLVAASVLSAAVFVMYQSQVQTQTTQLAIAEMQQQARAAMMLLEDDIRMAGTDPTGQADAQFITILNDRIHFTRDITGGAGDNKDNDRDGITDEIDEWYNGDIDPVIPQFDPQEDILYFLAAGIGPRPLFRQTDTANTSPTVVTKPQRVADNVEVIDFVYLDEDGNVTANAAQIRSVQITLIVSSDNPALLRNQEDTTDYFNLQGGPPILSSPNDLRRRIILSSEVRIRNTGLDV